MKAIKAKMSKTAIVNEIAEQSGVDKKTIVLVLSTLALVIQGCIMKGGIGQIILPFIGIKVRAIKKPATKQRKGTNPFTGEPHVFKAKKACTVVKTGPLKLLKDMVL